MSQHRSLRAIATVGGKRNVLKRFERVGLLKKRGPMEGWRPHHRLAQNQAGSVISCWNAERAWFERDGYFLKFRVSAFED